MNRCLVVAFGIHLLLSAVAGDPGREADAKTLATLAGLTELAVFSVPHPFNPSTTLYFHLPEDVPVSLVIYNVAGEPVTELIGGEDLAAGTRARQWRARRPRPARRLRPLPLPAHRRNRVPRRETRPHPIAHRSLPC